MTTRHQKSPDTTKKRQLQQEELILFISQDTCKVVNGEGSVSNAGQSMFLRVGRSRKDELRKCFLGIPLPDLSSVEVTDMKLCMYQYYTDVGASSADEFLLYSFNQEWSEDKSFSLKNKNIIAEDFSFSSTKEGKLCVSIASKHANILRNSKGVMLAGKNVGGIKKERYFLSSEWTSISKNITEGTQSQTYHPHWVITTKKIIENEPTAFPSQLVNPIMTVPTIDQTPINSESFPIETESSMKLIFTITSIALCCLILIIVLFVHRRKAERKHEQMLRTFVTQEDLDRRDKFSFNSLNSSNKDSGNSGASFKWIEKVRLDNAGDQTICNNIDRRIDNAALPEFEKPNVSARRLSASTPKQRNPSTPFDYLGKNTLRKGIQRTPTSQSRKCVGEYYDQINHEKQQQRQQTLQLQTIDNQQESIERMKERIKARKNLAQVQSQMRGHESNSILDSNGESYPSLFASFSDEEKDEMKSENDNATCMEEIARECEATKKDARCLWKEGFKSSSISDYSCSSYEDTSTYASTFTGSYK